MEFRAARPRFDPLLALLALVTTAPAARAVDFTLLGGLNYAAPTQRIAGNDIRWTGDAGFSYGLTVGTPLFDLPLEAETGIFVLQESSSRDGAGTGSASSRRNRMLQLPLVLRFNIDEHIGLGLGGYLAWGQGEVEQTVGNTVTRVSYATAGEKTSDAGLLANVRARFNLAPPFYFVIDARYQHGLANRAATDADLYNTRSIQAFAGFQYTLSTGDADEGYRRE